MQIDSDADTVVAVDVRRPVANSGYHQWAQVAAVEIA